MIFTIKFDASGNPVSFSQYSDAAIAPNPLPTGEVECTAEEFSNWQGCVFQNGEIVAAPDATIVAVARVAQISVLTTACSGAIISGFNSSALGVAHVYPSALTDQANQKTISQTSTGGLLWCEVGGVWSFSQHTQAQAEQVITDFAKWLNACQSQLVTLSEQIAQASTVAEVQAVKWVNPT